MGKQTPLFADYNHAAVQQMCKRKPNKTATVVLLAKKRAKKFLLAHEWVKSLPIKEVIRPQKELTRRRSDWCPNRERSFNFL